jgi:aspartate carbamoyltransferase catalytic subunit
MSLFDVSSLSIDQIIGYLDRAEAYRGKRTGDLLNLTVATIFFEASTRTRLSFELAATRLGAEVISFSPEQSSTSKGESLKDTAMTIASMGAQILVVRHSLVGSAQLVAKWTGLPVVNGGDGRGAHPTQTLLDLLTIRRHFGRLQDLEVAVVGDIRNSRVARGLLSALPRFGAQVTLVGPSSFVDGANPWSAIVSRDLDSVLAGVDVVYLLRVQKERGAGEGYPGDAGYHRRFGLTPERAELMRPGSVVMHPGPINRGVEVSSEVADGDRSLILEQVANGVPVRMAALAIEAGGLL